MGAVVFLEASLGVPVIFRPTITSSPPLRALPAHLITIYSYVYGRIAPIVGDRLPITAEHHAKELGLWNVSARNKEDSACMRYNAKALAIIYLVRLFNIGDEQIYKAMHIDFGDLVSDPDVRAWIMGYLAYERNLVLVCGRYELTRECYFYTKPIFISMYW